MQSLFFENFQLRKYWRYHRTLKPNINFQKCVNLAPNPWYFDLFFTSVQYCNNCMVFKDSLRDFIKQLYSKARTRFSIKSPRLSQDGLKWHDQFIFKGWRKLECWEPWGSLKKIDQQVSVQKMSGVIVVNSHIG